MADSPLIINQYHYGGMGLRGARPWLGQAESDFLTSLGKTRSDGNHTLARWVIAHGTSDGGPASVIALGHPGNFRAPQPVRLHPKIPYFCFAPMVFEPFEIAPGRPYHSRYRFATHDGPPDAQLADQLWRAYTEPLKVQVTATKGKAKPETRNPKPEINFMTENSTAQRESHERNTAPGTGGWFTGSIVP